MDLQKTEAKKSNFEFANDEGKKKVERKTKNLRDIFSVLITYAPAILRSPKVYVFLLVLSGLSIGSSLIPLVLPYLTRIVVDEAIPKGSARLFGFLAASAALLYFLLILIRVASTYVNVICETYVQKILREQVFDRLVELPMYIERTRAFGNISRRLINDIETYAGAIVKTVPTFIGQISMFIILCVIVARLNSFLLILMGISIPSILAVNLLSSRVYRKLITKGEAIRDDQVNTINMAAEGFVSLISFGVVGQVKKMFRKTISEEVALRLREWHVSVWKNNSEWLFTNGIAAIALWGAWYYTLQGSMSLGEAVAAIMYFGMILLPVLNIAATIHSTVAALVASGRLLEPVEFSSNFTKTNRNNGGIIVNNSNHPSAVQLRNVSFQYPGTIKLVLEKICLQVPFGCLVGLSGPSGVGKTTLGKVIAGHFRPTQGFIYSFQKATGAEGNDGPSRILYVPEDPFLLSGSIRDNIRFFSQKNDIRHMQQCIQDACLSDTIKGLPDGIDTELGKNKGGLSKGQSQRLLIARALYASDGKMIVFDESTSNIDSESEEKILTALERKAHEENINIFLISHRKQIMERCDIVYQMTWNGNLVSGTIDHIDKQRMAEYLDSSEETHNG